MGPHVRPRRRSYCPVPGDSKQSSSQLLSKESDSTGIEEDMMRKIIDSSIQRLHRGFSAKSAASRDLDGEKRRYLGTPTIDFSCIYCSDDVVRLFREMI
ncbi:hypothetical protein SASPL_145305 [Salvia splendens]|uniref:Uncharacterized protein n=1 Tax=Salvia splendens TaxID=180675 RepID=A0A8X8WHG3_SALSN|nr:hypothetical protein SASPL_145305 [Salvia splendens]